MHYVVYALFYARAVKVQVIGFAVTSIVPQHGSVCQPSPDKVKNCSQVGRDPMVRYWYPRLLSDFVESWQRVSCRLALLHGRVDTPRCHVLTPQFGCTLSVGSLRCDRGRRVSELSRSTFSGRRCFTLCASASPNAIKHIILSLRYDYDQWNHQKAERSWCVQR